MTDYDITIGPTEFFICKHPEPHDGPCERSAFLDVNICGARLADSRQDLCCERSSHHYTKPHQASAGSRAALRRHRSRGEVVRGRRLSPLADRPIRRCGMNRDEILQAVAKAAADYREATGELAEDLSLALALAESGLLDAPIADETS